MHKFFIASIASVLFSTVALADGAPTVNKKCLVLDQAIAFAQQMTMINHGRYQNFDQASVDRFLKVLNKDRKPNEQLHATNFLVMKFDDKGVDYIGMVTDNKVCSWLKLPSAVWQKFVAESLDTL